MTRPWLREGRVTGRFMLLSVRSVLGRQGGRGRTCLRCLCYRDGRVESAAGRWRIRRIMRIGALERLLGTDDECSINDDDLRLYKTGSFLSAVARLNKQVARSLVLLTSNQFDEPSQERQKCCQSPTPSTHTKARKSFPGESL